MHIKPLATKTQKDSGEPGKGRIGDAVKRMLSPIPLFSHFPFPLSFVLLWLIILSISSCSTERIAIQSSTAILKNTVLALNEEEDPNFAEKAIASQLKMLEGMIKSAPGNHELLLLASRGFCSYAFSFIEDNDMERAKIFYRRGLNYGF